MNSRELNDFIGEYPNLLARAGREGWLRPLLAAHLTECTRVTAEGLLRELGIPEGTGTRWRSGLCRGRAHWHQERRRYSITLPTEPGPRARRLRIGLVLHEAAHVIDHRKRFKKKFDHGPRFSKELRRLLEQHWTGSWREECTIKMSVSNFRDIYARHRGPFWILLSREIPRKGKMTQETDRVEGPLSAEEAHEEARVLVNNPKDTVYDAHVFSLTEGQFIGAVYRRGERYQPWSQLREAALAELEKENDGRVELPDQREAPALVPGGPEPLRPVDAPGDEQLPERAVPARRSVRNVPQQKAAGAKRRGAALELDPGNAERWPDSAGANLVRAALESIGRASAADLAQRIAADCAKAGIGFPGSLISRLKQAGFIREVQSE